MRRVTIDDISRYTSLSRGTVSRALNDRPDISRRTRDRVLEACEMLNYVPSHAARSLATGRNFAVVTLADDLRSPFTSAFVSGVTKSAERAGYVTYTTEIVSDAQEARRQIAALPIERVDAVLIASSISADNATVLREACAGRTIAACQAIDGIECDVFCPDHAEAGRLAAAHVITRGARSVLYVCRAGDVEGEDRLRGFREVCEQRDIDPDIVTVDDTPASYDALLAPLATVGAVVTADDAIGLAVMLRCERIGRQPGRDIAIVGQGNDRISGAAGTSLSTVDFNGCEIGERTMETVLQRIAKERLDTPATTLVAPRLIERASSGLSPN